MTGKNERKLKKWAALFLAAAMSLTACGSTADSAAAMIFLIVISHLHT